MNLCGYPPLEKGDGGGFNKEEYYVTTRDLRITGYS
jgi:hypothetical protein